MSFWNNDKYLSGLLTDDDLEPTEPPKPTVKVQTNGLYSTSGIGAFEVDVPQGTVPSGTLPITENGTYDVTEYASAEVDVPQGITPSGSITLTEERSYDVTDKATAVVDMSAKRASIAEVITSKGVDTLPDSDWDTLETNIGLISGGGGLPSSISKIDGGSFTLASDTASKTHEISHNLGEVPKGAIIYAVDNLVTPASLRIIRISAWNIDKGVLLELLSTGGDRATALKSSEFLTSINKFGVNVSTSYYKGGCTYNWLTWA